MLSVVSANLGVSYSIGNIFKEAGIGNVRRWISFDMRMKTSWVLSTIKWWGLQLYPWPLRI